jgi:hypothetical protein
MLELARVVSSVLTRLAEQGVSETPLEREWASILQTDEDEAEYCRSAARLGLDPYSMPEEYGDTILRAAEILPGELFGDFVDAAGPELMGDSLEWVARQSAEIESLHTTGKPGSRAAQDIGRLREQLSRSAVPHQQPWRLGWEQARRLRDVSQVGPLDMFDVKRYISSGVSPSPDGSLHVLGGLNGRGAAVAVLGRRSRPSGERFALARSMWHFIWEDGTYFLVTGAYTDRLKTERAFAAELLAPAAGIAEKLGVDPHSATEEDLEDVAQHFGVQPVLVSHQVRNQLMGAR